MENVSTLFNEVKWYHLDKAIEGHSLCMKIKVNEIGGFCINCVNNKTSGIALNLYVSHTHRVMWYPECTYMKFLIQQTLAQCHYFGMGGRYSQVWNTCLSSKETPHFLSCHKKRVPTCATRHWAVKAKYGKWNVCNTEINDLNKYTPSRKPICQHTTH